MNRLRQSDRTISLDRRGSLIRAMSLVSLLLFMGSAGLALAAGEGHVQSLSATGGNNYGDTITVSSVVVADQKIQNSNLYYEILDPGNNVVATDNGPSVPALEAGDSVSYSWASNNASYPSIGTYTVTLCWSPGKSLNCSIAQASYQFFSVSTLGDGLFIALIIGAALLAIWLVTVQRKVLAAKKQTL